MKRQTFTASVLLLVSFFTFFVWKVWADTSNAVNATVKISICGNNVVEGGEDCEGSNLNGKSCSDITGFSGGTLACDISCSFDTSNCIKTTVTPTPTPVVTFQPIANSATNSTATSPNTPTPTPSGVIKNTVKNLPALVQLFGSTETGTIPVTKLHSVMSSWVTSWRETQLPKQVPTTKTAAIATCDVNHDGVCDIRDFSVLLFYIQ